MSVAANMAEIMDIYSYTLKYVSFLAWAWLAKALGHSCHTKKSILAKVFTEKTSKSAKYHRPLRYEKKTG